MWEEPRCPPQPGQHLLLWVLQPAIQDPGGGAALPPRLAGRYEQAGVVGRLEQILQRPGVLLLRWRIEPEADAEGIRPLRCWPATLQPGRELQREGPQHFRRAFESGNANERIPPGSGDRCP